MRPDGKLGNTCRIRIRPSIRGRAQVEAPRRSLNPGRSRPRNVERMSDPQIPTVLDRRVDGIFIGYLLLTAPWAGLGASSPLIGGAAALGHLGGAGLIYYLSRHESSSLPFRLIRQCYPLALLLPLYAEAGLIAAGLHGGPVRWDELVVAWDRFLFAGHPHTYLRTVIADPAWSELFHAAYLSYYGLLVGAYLYVWTRKPEEFPRFAFVFSGAFVSFLILFAAFPVEGPMSGSPVPARAAGPCEWVVDLLYRAGGDTGLIGAFPSSHVGLSVVTALTLRPARIRTRTMLGLWVGLITISTVYGGFHYAVDAIAGLALGAGLWRGWTWIYDQTGGPAYLEEPALQRARSAH